MNYILLAMPFFIFLITVEIATDRIRGTQFYRINDSISSLNAGILSRINTVFRNFIPFAIYVYIEDNYALFQLNQSIVIWVAVFILYDLCYYWKHRFSHEINILWASHVVHHSSEEYNLTTALRQTSGSIFSWIFYLPLALLGFDPIGVVTVASLNLIYQFWVHTRHIPKLGWYEWLFVTPSNHRVHHAINSRYIDKNYGGVFIIWDKIFNSFQEELEDEVCVYGIRKQLKSWNPIWTNVHYYIQLAKDAWRTEKWQDKLLIWFKPTGWRPSDIEEKYPLEKYQASTFNKFDTSISNYQSWYCLIQYFIILVIALLFLSRITGLNSSEIILIGLFIVISCLSIGGILENKKWAFWSEFIRFPAVILSIHQLI